ncbi:unnamed protein product [Soboliphyme baturini]|uniref:LDLR chaperone boca n=1 Tax=Soboliphyme baturini TaxID=241478 RepID=A0A183IFU5_9BILA|nr:unnamed protein product [Soboliphyme baturini]
MDFSIQWLMLIGSCIAVHEPVSNKVNTGAAAGTKTKDIRDYTDADMERLYEEWEAGSEPLEEDELPEWKRPPPKQSFDPSKVSNPEELVRASKKSRTLMMFVGVSGTPSRDELEDITKLWQTSLFNAQIDVQRFIIDDHRAIFMFSDGAAAWDAKEYLINQERCSEVTIEGRSYPGKGAKATNKDEL